MILGGEAFGRWVDHVEIPSLFRLVRRQQEDASWEPGGGLSLDCGHAENLSLSFSASRTMRDIYMLPSVWHYVITFLMG